jgi:hypothetical protein
MKTELSRSATTRFVRKRRKKKKGQLRDPLPYKMGKMFKRTEGLALSLGSLLVFWVELSVQNRRIKTNGV